MIRINGVDFTPHPEIGFDDPFVTQYKHDYLKVSRDITDGILDELDAYRYLVLNDLWFVVYFILKVPANISNHPFWVRACREIENGPQDFTLDVWAREHGKSSIITIAETVQYALRNPDHSTGIFSVKRELAKAFLSSIKAIFESDQLLQACFSDVVWKNCERDSPRWSLDEGIILKRTTTRPDATIAAWGLIEGMPTGRHYDRRVYDDITTEDLANSPEMMEQVKNKYDSSQNLGKDGGHHRVIGTFYHHNDPLVYIQGKKAVDGQPKYLTRIKPATEDGTAQGKTVYLSQQRLNDLMSDRSFNTQQLCNPTPEADRKLNPAFLKPIERKFMPKGLYRFMLVDQAGDQDSALKKTGGDPWTVGLFNVEPSCDDLGQSRVFIEKLWVSPASESEAIEQIVRMYVQSGIIQRLGIEKVGISTTHLHVAAALRASGRWVNFEKGGNGMLLRPAGRNKKKFIGAALEWPLNNGMIHYCTDIPEEYITRLTTEFEKFPFWHDDISNILAYLYADMLKDYIFGSVEDEAERKKERYGMRREHKQSWMSV